MTFNHLTIPLIALLFFASCSSTKNLSSDALFSNTWELEYITGSRIAFEGLFPDEKPFLKFDENSQMVTGNASCNGYSSDYSLKGTNLNFGDRGITTLMYCGEGEQQFLSILEKIDSYSIDSDGKLNLLMDHIPMMRFHKK